MSMIPSLVTSALADAVAVVTNEGFFDSSTEARTTVAQKEFGDARFPELVSYLAQVKGDRFMADVAAAHAYAKGDAWPEHDGLLAALGRDLAGYVTDALDALGHWYFQESREERDRALETGDFAGPSALARTLRDFVAGSTYHGLAEGLRPFLSRCGYEGRVVVRTAAPLDSDARKDVRETLRAKYPNGYAAFYVDQGIGGGVRVFADGRMIDESWTAEVDRIFSTAINSK